MNLEFLAGSLEDAAAPFGNNLEYLRYQRLGNVFQQYAVPWCLLQHAANIRSLSLQASCGHFWTPGPTLLTPTAEDIRAIESLCPDLTYLSLDVALSFTAANLPILPYEVFEALARFKKTLTVGISLHVEKPETADFVMTRSVYYRIFHRMLNERERLELSCHPPFEVCFKIVRQWDKMGANKEAFDYRLEWEEGSSRISFVREKKWRLKSMQEIKRIYSKKYLRLRGAMRRTL